MAYSTLHRAMCRWDGTRWRFADGPPSYFVFVDCMKPGDAAVENVFTYARLQTGAVNVGPALGDHPGILRIASANTVSTSGGRVALTDQTVLAGGKAGQRFRAVINTRLVTNVLTRIGFLDTLTDTDATDGAYLEINNGTAVLKTAQANTRTANASSFTVLTDHWYTVHVFWETNTSVRCIVIDNNTDTVAYDVSNTTNLPTGTQYFGAGIISTVTTNSLGVTTLLDVDWLGLGHLV